MTNERERAWAAREKLKYDPLPLDEIARGEFYAGWRACERSERVRALVEALEWIAESGRRLRGNELCNEPYVILVQQYKNQEEVARQALAAWAKGEGDHDR